jgi:epsilon-lactone hydrolase
LRDDAEAYVEAAGRVGADVHLQRWPGLWHVHQVYAGLLPSADRAVRDLAAFLATGRVPRDAVAAGQHR